MRESRALPGSPGPDLGQVAAAFGHRLRLAGVPVTPERSTQFGAAVALTTPETVTELYWLARVTLVTGPEHIGDFNTVFDQVFRGFFDITGSQSDDGELIAAESDGSGEQQTQDAVPPQESGAAPAVTGATPGEQRGPAEDSDEAPSVLAAMSSVERLSEQEFAACTPDELELIASLIERLPVAPPRRRARRTRPSRQGTRWDVRRTLRRAHRTAGDPVHLVRRARTERPRRLVLLADVSGSMEPYARIYMHLMRGAVRALGAEAFLFATRLTRVTRMLGEGSPDAGYRRATAAAPDWSGGTRIGQAIADFVNHYGRRGMARGAVIVIVSDGWEVDDPTRIARAMQQLHRLAHHIIWVNPRKAATDYAPLVGGMAAALPYVDSFVSGHSLRALEEVVEAIAQVDRPKVIAC